jgi:ABC-type transport system involved in multi-copper enzyme maturation permease subunit
MGEGYRVTRDLGLAGISLIGLVLIVLVGGGMVQKEVERRTVLTVLSRPLRRPEFLLGKYLGLLGMVTMVFLGMTALLSTILLIKEGHLEAAVLWAAVFSLGELALLTAVVVLFSAFVSPALAGVFTVAVFLVGHFAEDLPRFAEKMGGGLADAARALFLVLPHLEAFNLRAEAAYGIVPEPGRILGAGLYGLLYTLALLAVGAVIFTRREFR